MADSQVQIPTSTGPNVGVIAKQTSGAVNENIERVASDTDQLNGSANSWTKLISQQPLNTTYENPTAISCEGKSQIIVKTEYQTAGQQGEMRVILIDFAGTNRFYSPIQRPAPTNDNVSPTDSGFFHGEVFSFPVMGAKQFNIRLIGQANASGNVSVWACPI